MTTRNTLWPALPGIVSPGVAMRRALLRVVVTASIHAGLASPSILATRSTMPLRRWAAAAGIAGLAVLLAADDGASGVDRRAAAMPAADTPSRSLRCRENHGDTLWDMPVLLD